jgi:hypothetical protein
VAQDLPGRQPGGSHHQGPPGQVHKDVGAEAKHFQVMTVRKDIAGGLRYKSYFMRRGQSYVRALTGKEVDAGLAQEEPLGVVGEEGLASQLT